jgi:hypothetical protein
MGRYGLCSQMDCLCFNEEKPHGCTHTPEAQFICAEPQHAPHEATPPTPVYNLYVKKTEPLMSQLTALAVKAVKNFELNKIRRRIREELHAG